MLIECLSAVCVLAIVIVGLLVMTQVISLEELGNAIWRGFLMIMLALVALCFLKAALLPILVSWVVALKQMLMWIAMIVLALVITLLVGRVFVSKFMHRPSASRDRDWREQ